MLVDTSEGTEHTPRGALENLLIAIIPVAGLVLVLGVALPVQAAYETKDLKT